MVKQNNNMKILNFLKETLSYLYDFIRALSFLYVVSETTNMHVGLIMLVFMHKNPEEYHILLDVLVHQGQMHTDDIYDVLKNALYKIPKISTLITRLQQRFSLHTDPVSADELLRFIHDLTPKGAASHAIDMHSNHKSGITISVTRSTQALLQRYPGVDLKRAYDNLKAHIYTLAPMQKQRILQALTLIESFNHQRHSLTQLTLQDIAGLTWHVLHDTRPSMWHENSTEAFTNRQEEFLHTLIYIASQHHTDALHATQKIPLCFTGIYNFCLGVIDRQHIDVTFDDSNPTTLLHKKIQTIMHTQLQIFDAQCPGAKKHIQEAVYASDLDDYAYDWLTTIRLKILHTMRQEFSSHIKDDLIEAYCSEDALLSLEMDDPYQGLSANKLL